MMNIYITKHYWKDGETATWECHEKIDKELFKYLKENYTLFIKDKPETLQVYQQFIYLCYEDTIDTFGRTITNVTFFVMKKKISRDFCSSVYDNLEIIIKESKIKTFVILGVSLLVLLGMYKYVSKVNFISQSNPIIIDINSSDVKKEVNHLSEKVKKEENTKEIFNQEISSKLNEWNMTITSKKDFDKLNKIWMDIKPKLKDKLKLLSGENKEKVNNLNESVSTYLNLFRNGIETTLSLEKLNKTVFFKTFKIIKEDFDGNLTVNEKEYECHIVVENTKSFFKSSKIFDNSFNINNIELIKLYHDEVLFKEINSDYRIKIEKINTGDSNGE